MGKLIDFTESNIRYALLTVIWLLYIWKLYLNLRQRKLMQSLVDMPGSLKDIMTKDVYDKARSYSLDKNTFGNVKDLVSTLFTMVSLYAFYYCWEWSLELIVFLGLSRSNEILASAACMFITNVLTVIIELPFKVYSTFVLEAKHGFNKQTAAFFVKDQIKKFVVMQIIALPLICGFIWIVQNGGDYFFLHLWVFTGVVMLFMMIIYPEVIAPLFDKYSPLPQGELREKIEALAASVDFPLTKLFIVEGSIRSSHSNAYMYGFHKNKRIVLFDTLVKEYYKPGENDPNKDQGCETDEVVGVLAHELGHWKFSHTLKGILLAQVNLMMNFILFARLLHYKPMYAAFGFTNSQPIYIGFVIVTMYILMPLNTLSSFLMTVLTRKFEFQADKFASKLGYTEAIKRALIKLEKDNLGYPLFDKLFSGWHHDHPPLLERLEALDKEN